MSASHEVTDLLGRWREGDPDALVNAIDPEWDGPIPYTVLVAPGGKIIWKHLGEVVPAELRRQIVSHLGRFYMP